MKMLMVADATHKQVKTQAAAKGMSIVEYVQYLADKESKRSKTK